MNRSHPATVRLNVDVYDQQNQAFRYHLGPSTSHLGSTRMIDCPTPPRTQSPATSISNSSASTTPSRGLGLLNCPFPSSLVDAYSTSSTASYHPAATSSDWATPVSTCGNSYQENSCLALLPSASHAISDPSLNAIAFYTSPAISSSFSMPTPSANIDFALSQHHMPATLLTSFQSGGCHPAKQEEDVESWFNDHITFEQSQSTIDLSSYGNVESPGLTPSHVTNPTPALSPDISFAVLAPASSGQRQQFESSPTVRSESVESGTTLQRLGSNQSSVNGRRLSANSERRYSCSVCNRSFDKKYNLREHEKKHDPSRMSQFKCPEPGCGKRLGRKTDVNRHVQSVHEKAKNFVCTRCFRRFDRKDTLSR